MPDSEAPVRKTRDFFERLCRALLSEGHVANMNTNERLPSWIYFFPKKVPPLSTLATSYKSSAPGKCSADRVISRKINHIEPHLILTTAAHDQQTHRQKTLPERARCIPHALWRILPPRMSTLLEGLFRFSLSDDGLTNATHIPTP